MKVLIHAVGADKGGGRRHLEALLPALSMLCSKHQYVVLVRDGVLGGRNWPGVEVRSMPSDQCRTGIRRFIFDQFSLPQLLKYEEFDVCVSLLNFGPIFCPAKHIIFQRNALYFDNEYLNTEPVLRRLRNKLRGWLAGLSVVRADVIVAPSQTLLGFLAKSFPKISGRKLTVLYHGFNNKLLGIGRELQDEVASNQVRPLSIFYPSHFARHKGFRTLFYAARELVNRGIDFTMTVTVDKDYWPEGFAWFESEISSPELEGRVVNLGTVPQSEMGELYLKSDVIFFPSLCESFGFPLLEAMGVGKPIVASDISINKEICSGGAEYFSKLDGSMAVDVLIKYVSAEHRAKASVRSCQRFSERDWSWISYAKRFDELIEQANDTI